jgi:hypothetical protein
MGLNDYLGILAEVDGATSINTISLVDIEVESFPPYIYIPTPWVKHTKTTVRGAPSLGNLWCSKLFFSPLSLAVTVVVAATLPSPAILSSATSKSAAVPVFLENKPTVQNMFTDFVFFI